MKQPGYADVVIGLQFGDEGKARVVDMLADEYDIIARFNGGANAGHTIETKAGKIALQQIPSGVFHPNMTLYVGSGCVINLRKVVAEIEKINALGLDISGRLHISSQASIVQPHHILIDSIIGKSVGTTKNGIGPCYADRSLRMDRDRILNIRLGDLFSESDEYFDLMQKNFVAAVEAYDIKDQDIDQTMKEIREAFDQVSKFIEHDPLFMEKQVSSGKNVIFEGAQSVMLDVVKGSVPYVTSSHTVAAAAYVGGDLSSKYHRKTIGVAKAVMSRVGHGPFPSEIGGMESEEYCMASENGKPTYGRAVEAEYDVKEHLASGEPMKVSKGLRILSGEYGTVTTRPRRIGYLDLVQLSFAARSNGVDELFLNKCDILNAFINCKDQKIPAVVGYELEGEKIDYFPASTKEGYAVKPEVKYYNAFGGDLSEIREPDQLPEEVKIFLKDVEEYTGSRINTIGVGPGRDQCVKLLSSI